MNAFKSIQYGPESAIALTELRSLSEAVQQLEESLDTCKRENESLESALLLERKKNEQDDERVEEERQKAKRLEDVISIMKTEMSELKAGNRLGFEGEEKWKEKIKEKNNEIDKYITEIQALTETNAQLSSEVESMTQELEATVQELERFVLFIIKNLASHLNKWNHKRLYPTLTQ